MTEKQYDLEERLLEYATVIVRLTDRTRNTRSGNHISDQLMRSGTSVLLNHGEAEVAESSKDFVHKMRLCLKELKESKRSLRLIKNVPLVEPASDVDPLLSETEELIRIFAASIRTAKKNMVKEQPCDAYTV